MAFAARNVQEMLDHIDRRFGCGEKFAVGELVDPQVDRLGLDASDVREEQFHHRDVTFAACYH